MGQSGEDPSFPQEALPHDFSDPAGVAQHLDGDLAFEIGIERPIDDGRPSLPQALHDPVLSDPFRQRRPRGAIIPCPTP